LRQEKAQKKKRPQKTRELCGRSEGRKKRRDKDGTGGGKKYSRDAGSLSAKEDCKGGSGIKHRERSGAEGDIDSSGRDLSSINPTSILIKRGGKNAKKEDVLPAV